MDQTYLTYKAIGAIIRIFAPMVLGSLSWFIVRICSKKIACGVVVYKLLRRTLLILSLAALLLYNFISYVAGYQISIIMEINIFIYILLGLVLPFIPRCLTSFPPFCYGRRRCCFKRQSSKTLMNVLTDIDKNIPTDEEILLLEERAKKYLYSFHKELEKEFLKQPINMLFTGSGAERFGLPLSSEWITTKKDIKNEHALLSDFDFMFYLQNLKASQDINSHFIIISNDLDPHIQPGYATLVMTEIGKNHLSLPGDTFLSAKVIKKRIYKALSMTNLNVYPAREANDLGDAILKSLKNTSLEVDKKGPAVKIKIGTLIGFPYTCLCVFLRNNVFLADLTFSIKSEWPSCVDWSTRNNRIWPAIEHIRRIESYGSHLVPKSQLNDHEELTWRFSFSQAEVELSKLVNPIARKCFLALKVITKDHLQPVAKWFTSYHIKTILFHTLEFTPLDMWVEGNLKQCFDLLIKELIKALDKRLCKHFWISSINLFEIDGVSCRNFSRLVSKVESIMQNPEWFIEDWDYNWDENSREVLWDAFVDRELEIISEETTWCNTADINSTLCTSVDSL